MSKKHKPQHHHKPRFQRSDIPYADRLLMDRQNTVAEHRDDAAEIALQVACVALNDTEGLGYFRLARFAKHTKELIDRYYADPEVESQHLQDRLKEMGFIVMDGHMYGLENTETGEVLPTKLLKEANHDKK